MAGNSLRILVVGAGPAGLAFALACASAGVRVRIIDKRSTRLTFGKATGVSLGTWRLLARFGITIAAVGEPIPMRNFAFHDEGKLIANVPVPELDSHPPAHLYPQVELERHIENVLNTLGVTVEYGITLVELRQSRDGTHVDLSLADATKDHAERAEVDWVIGADGAHSDVRRLLKAPFNGRDYPEQWSVAEISTALWPSSCQAQLFLRRAGTGLFLSQPHAGLVQGILNRPGASGELERHFPDGKLESYREFRASLRRVPTPRFGRSWLIGDAAHVQSPVGGQGINLAIWDGVNLADALLKNDMSVERRLASRARRILLFTDFDYRMLATQSSTLRMLRNTYWKVASRHPAIARWFFRIISGTW